MEALQLLFKEAYVDCHCARGHQAGRVAAALQRRASISTPHNALIPPSRFKGLGKMSRLSRNVKLHIGSQSSGKNFWAEIGLESFTLTAFLSLSCRASIHDYTDRLECDRFLVCDSLLRS